MLFVCYPKCSTCQKAKTWLQERGVAFDERDICLLYTSDAADE